LKRLLLLAALVALAAPASASAPRILASQDLFPVWSPDGTKIAFTRIERIGIPAWSPDSRSIAFQLSRVER